MDLRARAAHDISVDGAVKGVESFASLTPEAQQALMHELQVHQIELELQNEDLKRAKDDIEISKARYFDLYDKAPVGYCIADASGLVLEANRALASLLGATRSALAKQPLTRFIAQADQDIYYRMRQKLLANPVVAAATDEMVSCELRMVRSGSTQFWAHITATVVPGNVLQTGDKAIQLRLTLSDISASKQAEAMLLDQKQQLREANRNLEQRVKERTRDLEYSRNVAQIAMQSRGDFLANMSHEIRTPLNAITGMAYLIRKESLSPLQSERLEKLEASSAHLLCIINDVLDMSKIDAGMMQLEAEPLSVEDTVTSVVTMTDGRAQAKNIGLFCEIQELPRNLVGDRTRLKQALLNYVSNAIKFTAMGSVIVRVTLQEESDTDALLLFEVIDTGIGIDPPVLERLFSPFEQADNTTSREFGGTGLGLTITSKLAQLMGGQAGGRSVPGQGSTFWFTTRLAKVAKAPQFDTASSDQIAGDRLRTLHPGLRVLVVDDEPVNREIAAIQLEDAGCVVETAEDGVIAVEMAKRNTYDLFLMDLQMPGMNGLEATRKIREMPNFSTTPIIAMTANAFVEDRDRCLAAGMNAHLTKPVLPVVLYTAIMQSLAT